MPWTGVYFNGNPVELTAIPNPGYEFAYWDTNDVLTNVDTNSSIFLNITASTLFKAVFNYTGEFGKIAISELNYHSDSTRNADASGVPYFSVWIMVVTTPRIESRLTR